MSSEAAMESSDSTGTTANDGNHIPSDNIKMWQTESLVQRNVTGTRAKFFTGSEHPNYSQFFNNPEFSDVCLNVGCQSYYGHKIVLATCSEFFRTMFSPVWCVNEQSTKTIDLEESYLAEEVFPEFLHFLYTWSIWLSEENVIPILMMADKYMVAELIRICIDYMANNLSHETIIPWYKFSFEFKLEKLYNKCVSIISHNFDSYVENNQLMVLEVEELIPILNSGSLVTTSEFKVVTLILNWLKSYDRADHPDILEKLVNMMKYVRFPMLMPAELDKVEKIPELRESLPKILHLMYHGYKFHTLGHEGFLIKCDQNDERVKYFMPRIYLAQCSTLIQPTEITKTFHTPVHLSQSKRGSSITWVYKKGPETVTATHNVRETIRVRFVAITKQKVDGNFENHIIRDSILTLITPSTVIPLEFPSSKIHPYGCVISVLPKLL